MTASDPSWDLALEALLRAPSYSTEVRWTDQLIDRVGDVKTFAQAILPPTDGRGPSHAAVDPTRTRENHLRRLILAPLSPRKPVIIPCPAAAIKQRDKQKIEKVMRYRKAVSRMARITVPEKEKENGNLVRKPEVEMRPFSSLGSTRPVFYWGV
jgi:hypothetical protein